jgi:flagellin-like hook-associated protein FlgL
MKHDRIQPSAQELILSKDPSIVCETYLFEPAPEEERLGFLFAAAETEDRGGIGKPLLDTVMAAIQKEYYRDLTRSPSTSFEMALHQANLILYDTAESGVRDWMGHFHVAVGVLTGSQLHLSVAGAGAVFIARSSAVTNVSQGLSHFPITNPLKAFSQVATGDLTARDAIFFTSSPFDALFRSGDIGRFSLEHSASTVASRLEQLYLDQGHRVSLSVIVVTLLPAYVATPKQEEPASQPVERRSAITSVGAPRTPLIIKRSWATQTLMLIASIAGHMWTVIKSWVWPVVKQGSVKGGHALMSASKDATKKIHTISLPKPSLTGILRWAFSLPKSSKIFAGIALLLLVALGVSVVLLQHKRASDAAIQAASQKLQEARTKVDAAKTALIYDNREQASGLLTDAKKLITELSTGTLYLAEARKLSGDITEQQDRLQKIFRTNAVNTKTLGSFATALDSKTPERIFFVNGALYAASPETNTIAKMNLDGKAEKVHDTTTGIGFISSGTTQSSDKTIILSTDPAGIALFDTKDNSLTSQEFDGKSVANILSVFGNRLYIYDGSQENIFAYNKTLRGYVGGTPWITDPAVTKKDIVSIAIDGNIYALASTGAITKLFRGAPTEFTQQSVDPSLASATQIITSDTMQNLYVLDPKNKRVVVYTKKGGLVRQLFFENVVSISDIAVSPDETHLYALEGSNVVDVTLTEPSAQTAAGQ